MPLKNEGSPPLKKAGFLLLGNVFFSKLNTLFIKRSTILLSCCLHCRRRNVFFSLSKLQNDLRSRMKV